MAESTWPNEAGERRSEFRQATSTANAAKIYIDGVDPLAWIPQDGSQVAFLRAPWFEVLYEGTRGPGKTDAMIMDFAQHVNVGFGPAWRGIIFRRQYKELEDVVTKSRRWFREMFPTAVFLEGNSNYKWRFEDGEELLFRTIKKPEDYWNYHGHEYPWMGWEELCSWPDLELYHMMKSVCRSSYPGIPRKYRATANPYGPGHNAVKAYFIDPLRPGEVMFDEDGNTRCRIQGKLSENKKLLENDPNYMKRLLSAANAHGALKKAWSEGDWNIVAGGLIDDIWDEDEHVLEPFNIPPGWRIDRSFDWGSSKPFSVGWHAQSDGSPAIINGQPLHFARGTLFRIAEWYGWTGVSNKGLRYTDSEIARGIKKRESQYPWGSRVRPGPADSAIYDEHNGDSTAKIMERLGVRFVPGNKWPGSRIRGLQVFRTRLQASLTWPMEEPGYFVFDNCRDGFMRTVPTLPRDPKNDDDADSDAEDHTWDEVRYRVLQHVARVATGKVKKGQN